MADKSDLLKKRLGATNAEKELDKVSHETEKCVRLVRLCGWSEGIVRELMNDLT
jgi:hypothetical protein